MTDRCKHPRWSQAERYLPPVRLSLRLPVLAGLLAVIVFNAAPQEPNLVHSAKAGQVPAVAAPFNAVPTLELPAGRRETGIVSLRASQPDSRTGHSAQYPMSVAAPDIGYCAL